MATRIMIEDMLDSFCNLFGKNKTHALIDSWMKALSRFSDNQISNAGHKCMEDCSKMPTPQDVIQRMAINQTADGDKYHMNQARCHKCKRYLLCISEPPGDEWLCRECYTGLSNQEIAERFQKLGEKMPGDNVLA